MNLKKTGELIKLKRKELGITQEELAKKLNITEKAISRWETGRGAPDISLLIPLSKELNVSVLEILNGEKVEDENKTVVNILKEGNKKLNIFKRFPIRVNGVHMNYNDEMTLSHKSIINIGNQEFFFLLPD